MQMNRRQQVPNRRSGFTLIELMMVIVVIAIMAAFLVPAVGRSIRTARVAGVVTEISQFEAAIAKFKADHGIEPPSSITLYENGGGGTNWDAVSASFIRQIWPNYDFGAHDINGNGTTTDVINLTVGECLVFFLGGVNGNTTASLSSTSLNNNPNNQATTYIGACTGFSKNPNSPFDRGGSREAPLFDFLPARFTDLDADGFPEYKDALPGQKMPYLYYSGYDGQGYAVTSGGAGTVYFTKEFGTPMTQCYYQDVAMTQPWKPNSHQIISPGFDGASVPITTVSGLTVSAYGYGGAYLQKNNPTLPINTAITVQALSSRRYEWDNITNFSGGELSPY